MKHHETENDGGESHRTFEQMFVQEGMSFALVSTENGIARDALKRLFYQFMTLSSSSTVIRTVAANMGEDPETLFPSSLYRQQIFHSVRDTPGYKILARDHALAFKKKDAFNFEKLCDQCGLKEKDTSRLQSLLLGTQPIRGNKKFCTKAAKKLKIPLHGLFPPHIYDDEPARIPFSNRSQYIDDEPVALEMLEEQEEDSETSAHSLADIMESLLSRLPPSEQGIIREHFYRGKSLEKIGKREGKTKGGMSLIMIKILARLRKILCAPSFADELQLLGTRGKNGNRIRR